ncbi:F-box protein At5g07610-like [Durio zibethinus]|uniref:F-box protein At5g07610-like n=1 Tax=Durio zibethinus TaxID=66656 RepID=A0A6P5Z6V2_DURZI|nr:F-box protein At5g07610-like [Durio zibethinus]
MENSAEKIGNSQDILTHLLLRLPTKSLLKFKCVSKQWLSTISNPQFCLSHTRHRQHNGFLEPTALLLKPYLTANLEFDMVPLKHYSEVPFFHYLNTSGIILRESCDGLFLCQPLDFHDHGDTRFFICNPTTKKFKILSFPSKPPTFVNLAFDPLKSLHYKVICIRPAVSDEDYDFEINIYSSETETWTATGIDFEADEESIMFEGIMFEDTVVFCNGKIHWDSVGNESLYFDVEKECLQKMPMPTLPDGSDIISDMDRYFGEARGTLYIALAHYNLGHVDLYVFEMATDYSNWFLKRRLDLDDAMRVFPEIKLGCLLSFSGLSGLCFIQSEKEKEPKVVMWADGKIICYDFNDGSWKMLYDPGPGVKIGSNQIKGLNHLHRQRFLAFKYFENLSCI